MAPRTSPGPQPSRSFSVPPGRRRPTRGNPACPGSTRPHEQSQGPVSTSQAYLTGPTFNSEGTQALSPAEFNAGGPATTVTRHVNCARQPVNRAALERLVIGPVLDRSVDAGISPAEHALNLSSARSPRAHCRRDSKIIRRNRLLRCTRAVQIPTQTSNFSYFHSRKNLKNRMFSMLDATAAPE